jgi:hypothetical protein
MVPARAALSSSVVLSSNFKAGMGRKIRKTASYHFSIKELY